MIEIAGCDQTQTRIHTWVAKGKRDNTHFGNRHLLGEIKMKKRKIY